MNTALNVWLKDWPQSSKDLTESVYSQFAKSFSTVWLQLSINISISEAGILIKAENNKAFAAAAHFGSAEIQSEVCVHMKKITALAWI